MGHLSIDFITTIFPCKLAAYSNIINDVIFVLYLLKRFNNFGHSATRPRRHVAFLDKPQKIYNLFLSETNSIKHKMFFHKVIIFKMQTKIFRGY